MGTQTSSMVGVMLIVVYAMGGTVSPQMVNRITATLVRFAATEIAQVIVVTFLFAHMLTGALARDLTQSCAISDVA
jgi:hypothetical protein